MAWRFYRSLVALDAGDQRAQMLQIAARIISGKHRKRAVVRKQPFAPALDQVLRCGVLARRAVPLLEPGADRRRIDFAHQLADILHLAAAALEIPDALRLEDRLQQAFRQLDLRELSGIELNQSRADFLQRFHLAFTLRFAGSFRFFHAS